MTTLGMQVIKELKRRGLFGGYFDFSGYQLLKKIDDLNALHSFFHEHGYDVEPCRTDAMHLVDFLELQEMKKARKWWAWWWILLWI